MSAYYVVEPEVAGSWGERTKFTRTPNQPVAVHELHYQFDGWLGDELLESTPCFIVTAKMAGEITRAALTGVSYDQVLTSKSEQFEELFPDRELPLFNWLKVEGVPGKDDFGVTTALQLVVSAQALAVLEAVGISNASVEQFQESGRLE